MSSRAITWQQALLLVATSVSFASSVVLNKLLIVVLPPITLAGARALLAVPFCLLAMRLMARPLPKASADRVAIALASLGIIVVPYVAVAIGQQTIASGVSGILYSVTPLVTLLLGWLFLRDEPLRWDRLLGILIGMAGVVAVIGPSMLGGLGEHAVAELITLCGPTAYAAAMVVMRRARHIDPVALTGGAFVFAAIILVPLAWWVEGAPLGQLDLPSVALLTAMAVFGTIAPAVLNYMLVQQVGATRAAIAMFLMPVIVVLAGWLFLDERLGLNALAGLALILSGSVLVTVGVRATPRVESGSRVAVSGGER